MHHAAFARRARRGIADRRVYLISYVWRRHVIVDDSDLHACHNATTNNDAAACRPHDFSWDLLFGALNRPPLCTSRSDDAIGSLFVAMVHTDSTLRATLRQRHVRGMPLSSSECSFGSWAKRASCSFLSDSIPIPLDPIAVFDSRSRNASVGARHCVHPALNSSISPPPLRSRRAHVLAIVAPILQNALTPSLGLRRLPTTESGAACSRQSRSPRGCNWACSGRVFLGVLDIFNISRACARNNPIFRRALLSCPSPQYIVLVPPHFSCPSRLPTALRRIDDRPRLAQSAWQPRACPL
ncbi:hypothetical protein B0H14DRAFT_3663812 [Mycena olivaceomarginata]|nr:hypothetical protein B0H14DRAFT_3663812 [Mycena olivaceomarginata]